MRFGGLVLCLRIASCGGGGGGSGGSGSFKPATAPADVCSLLTLADVQAVLPGALPGVVVPTTDYPDVWVRDCQWADSAGFASVELVIQGALTSRGDQGLDVLVTTGPGNGQKTPVSGLGDKAMYWVDMTDQGLVAKHGSYAISVTAYLFNQAPTEAQLAPLVLKAMGEL